MYVYVWFVLCYQSSIFISFYFGLSIYQIPTQRSLNAAKGKEGVRWEFPRLAEEDEGRQILGTVVHHWLQTGQSRTLPIAKQSRNNIGKVLCRQARVCHKLLEKGTYQRCFFWWILAVQAYASPMNFSKTLLFPSGREFPVCPLASCPMTLSLLISLLCTVNKNEALSTSLPLCFWLKSYLEA